MTTYHMRDRMERRTESGRMVTLYRKRWVSKRVQDLMLESDIKSDDALKQAEQGWIEFTNCPF